jgi:AcrR family transcriptional regulator
MGKQGVDGTSMRDLAAAADLNVATLYHYFPSKQDLLRAVLEERGYMEALAGPSPTNWDDTPGTVAELFADMVKSTVDIEDFVRLMLGETLRGDETALSVGRELLTQTQASLERWLEDSYPDLCERHGADSLAYMLRALLIGIFFEHLAGTIGGEDPHEALRERALTVVRVLEDREG